MSPTSRSLAALALLALLAPLGRPAARAQDAPERQEAPEPARELTPEERARERARALERVPERLRPLVERVTSDASARCELSERAVESSTRVYRALLRRLPLASRILSALELGEYTIEELPDGRFEIDDRSGARAVCERALDEQGRMVVVARGRLDVPVLPTIRGTGVILIDYPERPAAAGGGLTCSAAVAFRVENGLLHRVSRALGDTLAQVLEQKLARLVQAAIALSEEIAADPADVYARLRASGELEEEELTEFRELFLLL